MSKKIYGVTVGTPISPNKIDEVLHPVKSVNGKSPDKNGNVSIPGLGTAASEVNDSTSLIKQNPENVLPYASVDVVGGKTRKCRNLLDISAYCKNTGKLNSDGSVTVAASGDFNCDVNYRGKLPSGTYTVSNLLGKKLYIQFSSGDYSNSVEVGDTKTFTYDGVSYLRFIGNDQSSSESVAYKVMLNPGTTALPYEPYFEGLRNTAVREFDSVGANLIAFPYEDTSKNVNGLTFTVNSDGSINIKGTCTAATNFWLWGDGSLLDLGVKDGETLFVNSNSTFGFGVYDVTDGIAYRNTTFIVNKNHVYRIRINFNLNETLNETCYPMLNRGSTALPYEPYRKSTLSIPEAVQAIDGYGCGIDDTIYNYVDWENKQFVKKVGKVDMGTLSWRANSTSTPYVYYARISDIKPASSMAMKNTGLLCLRYKLSETTNVTDIQDKAMYRNVFTSSVSTAIMIKDSDFETAELLTDSLQGVMLYYELAEPVITDISELLSPDNMLEVYEGGTVEVVTDDDYAESVPTSITYYYGGNDIVGGKEIIGNLKGVASRANTAMKDGNGNVIATYYAPAPIISKTDITAGVTPLATGQSYHVYE